MPLTRIRQTAIGNDSITSAKLAHDLDLDGDFVRVPHGTTAQRPSSPVAGYMRFNTDQGTLEQWNTTTNSWQAIDSPPIITSLAYSGSLTAADPVGGETITLTGTNFKSGATVTVGGTSATSISVVNSTTITFTTPVKTAGDYDVIVINANGLQATLTNGISYNGTPSFTTAAGNVGSIAEDAAMSTITIVAAEPDGGTLAFSVTSGALPTGVSMSSAGAITGTPNVNPTSDTTFNFTVTATDDENQTNSRAFNLIVLRPIYATQLNNSARFDDNRAAFLTRTPSSAGNRKTWTWSAWVKRGNLSYDQSVLFSAAQSQTASKLTTDARFVFGSDNKIYLDIAGFGNLGTAAVFRDNSAWYHVVAVLDTTQATQSDRLKIYVNGIQQSLSGGLTINQNDEFAVNNNLIQYLGYFYRESWFFDGYLSDIHFIDGQALTPTSFAEEYYGVWVPKAYSGTYGTNGFHLDFETDSQDSSGNNNHWIPNSLGGSLVKYSGSNLDYPNNLYKILDGDNSTAAGAQGPNTGTSASFIYTPATPITVSSSLKFKYSTGQTDCKYKINGGSYVNLGSSGTVDFNTGFTGTLTSIEWYVANSNSLISVFDLRVDDVQVINYDIGHDNLSDTPTSNFAVMSNLTTNTGSHLPTSGNLKLPKANNKGMASTFAVNSGKWYWEIKINNEGGSAPYMGVSERHFVYDPDSQGLNGNHTSYANYGSTNQVTNFTASSATNAGSGAEYGIAGYELDMDGGTLKYYFNGSLIHTDSTIPTDGRHIAVYHGKTFSGVTDGWNSTIYNFGQNGTFDGTETAGGNADDNGVGDFKYAPSSGYLALSTKNFAESDMATNIDDRPEDYMTTALWTQDVNNPASGEKSINLGFRPDLVWSKNRDNAEHHYLMDSVRGNAGDKFLALPSTSAEQGEQSVNNTGAYYDFTSTGFDIIDDNSAVGEIYYTNRTYVGWTWKAGGAPTATNSATSGAMTANSVSVNGTLESAYTPTGSPTLYPTKMSVNTKAGFSIIGWTGDGTAGRTIPHGLDSTPEFMILRGRDARAWITYHKDYTNASYYCSLHNNSAQGVDNAQFNSTAPTSDVFTVGSYNVVNNVNYIGYIWHSVPGFSKIGSYTGTGDANGPTVYTGFKVGWIVVKRFNTTGNWFYLDNKRDPYNDSSGNRLYEGAQAEHNDPAYAIDFLANGFKLRSSSNVNASGTYLYMCFAEDPFKYAEAR